MCRNMLQKVAMEIPVTLGVMLLVGGVLAGTNCPSGPNLDMWMCTTVMSSNGQQFTILSCQGGFCQRGSSVAKIPPERGMYDVLVMSRTSNLLLPARWLEYVRVRELQIVDSVLPENFLNESALFGQQEFMTSLSLRNTSMSSPLCSYSCPSTIVYDRYGYRETRMEDTRLDGLQYLPNLQHLDLSCNKIPNVTADSFPRTLIGLEVINLSYNNIDVICNESLAFMPHLAQVNLAHNLLTDITRRVFQIPDKHLQSLNLSWNRLSSLPVDLFSDMEALTEVDVSYNQLQTLHIETWKHIKGTLTWLNARGNFIICDCNLTWINDLPVTSEVYGTCVSPVTLDKKDLRIISAWIPCMSNETSVSQNDLR